MRCVTCENWWPCTAHARLPDVLASFSGKTANASAVARRLLVSHTTAAEWIRDMERMNLLCLVPSFAGNHRPLLLVRGSLQGRLLGALKAIPAGARISWWRIGARPIVFILDRASERVGFCAATSVVPRRADWLPLVLAHRRAIIDRGLLLHADAGASVKTPAVVALPLDAFLEAPWTWIDRTADERSALNAAWQLNRERLARWTAHR
jgi:hypothetical protein